MFIFYPLSRIFEGRATGSQLFAIPIKGHDNFSFICNDMELPFYLLQSGNSLSFIIIIMNAKMSGLLEIESRGSTATNKGEAMGWKVRSAAEEQRKLLKRRLFGEHYNHTRVGLNKEKQYLLQEQKNTEIERNNLILLQKIQKITKRSPGLDLPRRLNTQREVCFEQGEGSARTNNMRINRLRYENRMVGLQDGEIKSSFSAQKSSRLSKRYVFQGLLDVGGSSYEIKTYFEEEKYVIRLYLGEAIQRIKVRREDYMDIYNDLLEKKHCNIISLLSFNGKLFQLEKVRPVGVEVEVEREVEREKEVRLPAIERR